MSVGSTLKEWLRTQKDNSVSFVLEKMLRTRLEPYGSVSAFSLDSKRNHASLTILLKGETEPVTLEIQEYALTADAEGQYLVVKQAATSREWLTVLVQDLLVGRRLPIPEKYAAYAKLLL
jgi:hypothetical protein